MMHTQQKKLQGTGGENPMCQRQEDQKKRGTGEETNLKANYWNPPIRRRGEHMKKQNKGNKKKTEKPIDNKHKKQQGENTRRDCHQTK